MFVERQPALQLWKAHPDSLFEMSAREPFLCHPGFISLQPSATVHSKAQDSAREGAVRTKEEAKSLYASAKDTLSGWLGGKEHAGLERKDDVDRAVEGTQDAIARNVSKASDTVRTACIWALIQIMTNALFWRTSNTKPVMCRVLHKSRPWPFLKVSLHGPSPCD